MRRLMDYGVCGEEAAGQPLISVQLLECSISQNHNMGGRSVGQDPESRPDQEEQQVSVDVHQAPRGHGNSQSKGCRDINGVPEDAID